LKAEGFIHHIRRENVGSYSSLNSIKKIENVTIMLYSKPPKEDNSKEVTKEPAHLPVKYEEV
jgi:hypothetical protein